MTSSVSSASADESKLVETSLSLITEHVQVQSTAAPVMYTVPASNVTSNQQQAEITKIAPKMSQMQENVPVPNFQLPNLSSNPAVPLASETIPSSVRLEQDQISLHPRQLLAEDVGDLDN